MKLLILAPFCFIMVGCASAPTPIQEEAISDAVTLERGASELELSDQAPVAKTEVLTGGIGMPISKYLTGYRYLQQPNNTATEVSVWVTRDNSHRFHVPWHIGGSWFNDTSEKIIVDPVNKTVSIGFEQVISSEESCSEDQKVADRSGHGYFVCNSLFADFKLIEKNKKIESEKASEVASLEGDDDTTSFWQKFTRLFDDANLPPSEVLDNNVETEISISQAAVDEDIARYEVTIDLEHLALTVTQLNLIIKAERKLSGESEPMDKLEKRLMAKLYASKKYYERSLRALQKKSIKEYGLSVNSKALKLDTQTFDKSGYFNYDITWPMAVTVSSLSIEKKKFYYTNFIREFKKYEINDASEALASLSLSKMKKQYRKDRIEVLSYLEELTSKYRVDCNYPKVIDDYRVSVKCPEFATALENDIPVSLIYEVLAKRFDQVIPRYTNHNNDLTITADSETLLITNNSNGHLKINGIEWLANNAAQSITRHTDKAKIFSIAQGESVEISLNDSIGDDLKKALEIPYLSRRKALRKHLSYGFDVSYQVQEEGQAQPSEAARLHQKNRYDLNELLLSR